MLDRDKFPVSAESLIDALELLHRFILEERKFAQDLLQGRIHTARIPARDNVLAGPLKAVHSMLQHLIWLMNRVGAGDYRQHLNFADDLSDSFNRMVDYLVELSFQDKLTGLLNVDGFDTKAKNLLESAPLHEAYFLLNINVNDFKHFNVLYGPEKGDHLLVKVARFLAETCQKDELCARIHADNFMCLLHGKSAKNIAERLNVDHAGIWPGRIVSRTYLFRHGVYEIQDRNLSIRQMRHFAAFASMSVQNNAKCNYAIFDEALSEQYHLENTILENFERAISEREFEVYYQPKVDTKTGCIVSCEALVRWNTRKDGLLTPDRFISLFEANGLITVLDFYVFDRVCAALSSFIYYNKGVPIAVNFSSAHLLEADFVQRLLAILQKYSLSPAWLEIEITETAFFENMDTMIAMIQELHEAGFSIAMDDFGSGFSSLNFLRSLPIDVMKIDKLFFKNFDEDQHGRLLLQDILSMAGHLGLKTVAEGIETKAQAEFLKEHKCDMIQGYYFYRPMPEEELHELLIH